MKLTKEFKDYLYKYWLNTFDEICEYCENAVECFGKDCDKYEEYKKSSFLKRNLTCMDLDFAECPKLKGTPCETCNCINNFEWSGAVPEIEEF